MREKVTIEEQSLIHVVHRLLKDEIVYSGFSKYNVQNNCKIEDFAYR